MRSAPASPAWLGDAKALPAAGEPPAGSTPRPSGLARIPIPTFGIGMGVLGLGLCWRYSAVVFHLSPLIGNLILLAGTGLWGAATLVQLGRLAVASSSVGEELAHAIR